MGVWCIDTWWKKLLVVNAMAWSLLLTLVLLVNLFFEFVGVW